MVRIFFRFSCPRESTVIQWCSLGNCSELLCVHFGLCQLAVVNYYSLFIHVSSSLYRDLEIIHFCCTFCKRFNTPGKCFITVFYSLFTSFYLTSRLITGHYYTLSPCHLSASPSLPSELLSSSEPLLEPAHEADVQTFVKRDRCCNKSPAISNCAGHHSVLV